MPYHLADDGCRIHFDQRGAGPDCILIPGLGGDGTFWCGVADRLMDQHRLVLVDHRGAGASDRPTSGYSIPRIMRDVVGIMDDLGLTRAEIVGHSTGGMVAQTLSVTHAARVNRLVLSGTWARPDLRFRRMFEARLALLLGAGAVPYHKLTQALGHDAEWMESHRVELDAELDTAAERLAPLAVQSQRIEMLMTHDVYDLLPDIDVPTLVVGADDDALIPFSASRDLAARIPAARLAKLSGGHFFPRSHPESYAELIAGFLKEGL
jgi:aminoacrylate hydrolase